MKKIIVLAGLVAMTGCASQKAPKIWGNVIPKPDNTYTVEARGESAQNVTARVLESATVVCKDRGLRHVVTSNKAEYKGQYGTEAARDLIDQQAKTIAAMRGQTWLYPYYERRNDYAGVADFRCES